MTELLDFILSQGEQFRRARLASLYSDFRVQKSTNPDGFAANISAWENALTKAARAGLIPGPHGSRSHDLLSLRTGEGLSRALETKDWGQPLAIGAVILGWQDEAILQRRMIPMQDFLTSKTSIYDRSWASQPWWLLSWGLRQIGLTHGTFATGKIHTGRFVIVANVEEIGDKILSQVSNQSNRMDRTYSVDDFRQEVAKMISLQEDLTDGDLSIIVTHLARDKKAVAYNSQIIKFKGPGEALSSILSEDHAIVSLKKLIADLNTRVASLTVRVKALSDSAQKAVEAKNRVSALAALKSKKLTESKLARSSDTLLQLEDVYSKIEQAADQIEVVRVMEASTRILRSLHAEIGGVERVDDVAEGLRDEIFKVNEIGDAIQEAGQESYAVDESAIDHELEAMVQQNRTEEEEKGAQHTKQRLAEIDSETHLKTSQVLGNEARRKSQSPTLDSIVEISLVDGISALNRLSLDRKQVFPEEHDSTHNQSSEALARAIPEN